MSEPKNEYFERTQIQRQMAREIEERLKDKPVVVKTDGNTKSNPSVIVEPKDGISGPNLTASLERNIQGEIFVGIDNGIPQNPSYSGKNYTVREAIEEICQRYEDQMNL